jgi:hypothetical protein
VTPNERPESGESRRTVRSGSRSAAPEGESAEFLRGTADGKTAAAGWLESGKRTWELLLAAKELAGRDRRTERQEYEAGFGAGLAEALQTGVDAARAERDAAKAA